MNFTSLASQGIIEQKTAGGCLMPKRFQKPHIVDLPKIEDYRGNLTFIESSRHIPFTIKRAYYLYDVPSGASRASHGHKTLQQVMIALSGSFNVVLDNGKIKTPFHLNRPNLGLYIPPMIWRDLHNFSSGAVCLVLASAYYDEGDYYRNYVDFLKDTQGASD